MIDNNKEEIELNDEFKPNKYRVSDVSFYTEDGSDNYKHISVINEEEVKISVNNKNSSDEYSESSDYNNSDNINEGYETSEHMSRIFHQKTLALQKRQETEIEYTQTSLENENILDDRSSLTWIKDTVLLWGDTSKKYQTNSDNNCIKKIFQFFESGNDPYVSIILLPNKEKFNTNSIKGGGKNVKWLNSDKNHYIFNIDSFNTSKYPWLLVEMYDYEVGQTDRFIGTKNVPIIHCLDNPNKQHILKCTLRNGKKFAGKLTLALKFIPNDINNIYSGGKLDITVLYADDLWELSDFDTLSPGFILLCSLTVALFTLIVSLLFKSLEDWSYVDSFYFVAVTLSTVGYGDFSPSTNGGKILSIFSILVATLGILVAFSLVVEFIAEKHVAQAINKRQASKNHDKYLDKISERTSIAVGKSRSSVFNRIRKSLNIIDESNKETKQQIAHLCLFIGWILLWSIFFKFNENINYLDALYFAIVTASTVGYGDLSATKTSSKIFTVFTVMLGVVTLAVLASTVTKLIHKKRFMKVQKDILDMTLTSHEQIQNFDISGDGKIDKYEFLSMIIVMLQICKQSQIDRIMEKFNELDTTGNGEIDVKDFINKKDDLITLIRLASH